MTGFAVKSLKLREFIPTTFSRDDISDELGKTLWVEYGKQISVDFPSPKSNGQWVLTSTGWVGHIRLAEALSIALLPKVTLDNLFRMLEVAYNLDEFRFLPGLIGCASLDDLYQRLANILARRVLDRGRKGLFREYLSLSERLPYLKGRMDVRDAYLRPWDVGFQCNFEEHTADIEDNQILAWTLYSIARSGVCGETVLSTVRQAYLQLRGAASLVPFPSSACISRFYHRLNNDYQPMHAICRFFLDNMGPSHDCGGRTMLPFLVNMGRLYELFVARWLDAHLPATYRLKRQETVELHDANALKLKIDLVLTDAATERAICVMDTKYKNPERPDIEDISKVVAYAEVKSTKHAFLIYPEPLPNPLKTHLGQIEVSSLCFGLSGDLDQRGEGFLKDLLTRISAFSNDTP